MSLGQSEESQVQSRMGFRPAALVMTGFPPRAKGVAHQDPHHLLCHQETGSQISLIKHSLSRLNVSRDSSLGLSS